MSIKLDDLDLDEARHKLQLFSALNGRVPLEAFFTIRDNPGIAFGEIVKKVGAKDTLVAYRLAILKAAGLVTFTYERRGRRTSSYRLTDLGKKVVKELAQVL